MRLDSALKNVKSTIIVYLLNSVLQFIVRIVFIKTLAIEYLGINGLFSDILAVLSLAELGIGPAIVYSLYNPLALGDKKTLKSIMHIFKKAYIYIGTLILVVGFFLTFWLDFFIKGESNIHGLEYIYLLFVFDTGISYFYAYKRNLLIADQRQYIANFYRGIFQVITGLGQITFLFITHSYWAFIIIKVAATLTENFLVAKKAEDLYPFLKEKDVQPLAENIKANIIKNVKALFFHKLGGVAVFGTASLIIAKFVGLVAVGLYSNYYLIINSLQRIQAQIFDSITASVGNLNTLETSEKKVEVFKNLGFITAWLSFYITVGLYVMINPLIELWLGEKFICSTAVVNILILNFYLYCMRKPVLVFKNAMGLFWNNRYMPLFEAIINLTAGIYLAKLYGMQGALIGITISTLLMPFWVEPYIVLKNGLDLTFKKYYVYYALFSLITFLTALGMKYLYDFIFLENTILSFLSGVILITVVANLIWLVIFYKTNEFKYLLKLLKDKILKN